MLPGRNDGLCADGKCWSHLCYFLSYFTPEVCQEGIRRRGREATSKAELETQLAPAEPSQGSEGSQALDCLRCRQDSSRLHRCPLPIRPSWSLFSRTAGEGKSNSFRPRLSFPTQNSARPTHFLSMTVDEDTCSLDQMCSTRLLA